jgi:CheY-like chemotaxis protein
VASIRRVLHYLLETLGFDVRAATQPEEAFAIADAEQDFQILITEFVLPGIGGRTLAGFVRQRMPEARVLYLCDELAQEGIEAQGEAALAKPFSPEQLSEMLERLLEARR